MLVARKVLTLNYWQEHLKIGTLSVPRFLGGPLDMLTDEPFRQTTRRFCQRSLLYTEIRHVAALVNMPRARVEIDQATRPLNFQITASSTHCVAEACEILQEIGVDAVDLNIGCPASHIVKSGAGSALMADIPRLLSIVVMLREKLTCPLTVKMRAGFKETNAAIVAKSLEQAGVDAITVHPRLQTQRFRGTPDYSLIENIKKQLHIPVLVSGGIIDMQTAQTVYEQTGADGFLIGRGQLGKPWLLHALYHESRGTSNGSKYIPSSDVVRSTIQAHMLAIAARYGGRGLSLAKRHIGFYARGYPSAAAVRRQVEQCMTWDAMYNLVATMPLGTMP